MAKSGVIHTERLVLEPFTEKYLTEKYVGWLNDSEVVRFSEQRLVRHTIESCRIYMHSYDTGPNYFWAIVAHDPAEGHIGNINAILDLKNGVADIGIIIGDRSTWGRGYGREGFAAVIGFLLNEVGIRKVTAGTVAPNIAMINIMQKCGMSLDGVRKRQVVIDSNEVDIIHMAMFREAPPGYPLCPRVANLTRGDKE